MVRLRITGAGFGPKGRVNSQGSGFGLRGCTLRAKVSGV